MKTVKQKHDFSPASQKATPMRVSYMARAVNVASAIGKVVSTVKSLPLFTVERNEQRIMEM